MRSRQFISEWLRALKRNPAQIFRKSRSWQCPLCGFEGWFVDMAGRRDSRCPACGSRERDRTIGLYWRREPWNFGEADILHFSPEKSIWPMLKENPGFEVSDIEVSDEDDRRHRLRAPMVDQVFLATKPGGNDLDAA